MRFVVSLTLAFSALTMPSRALAQPAAKFRPPEITKIHVGFRTFRDQDHTRYKVGLWTPVYVEVFGGSDGIEANADHYLKIDTVDSDDVGTEFRVPVALEPLETRTFIGFVKTGHMMRSFGEIPVTLYSKRGRSNPCASELSAPMPPDSHLYLVLGSRMTDLYQATKEMGQPIGERDLDENRFRQTVYETDVNRLPETWFGYNGIDLVVLATENRAFLTALGQSRDRLKALAQWVRRGGRLIVPIAPQNQDVVVALLKNDYAWAPPIPVVPPKAPGNLTLDHLQKLAEWGHGQADPFHHVDPKTKKTVPAPIAALDPGRVPPGDWDVAAASDDLANRPLVAHVRYGLGKITYVAISLEDSGFYQWTGKKKFLQAMIEKLAPRAPTNVDDRMKNMGFREFDSPDDLSTDLIRVLDQFDVTVIPFGYVALFIVLYILVVGPLDFFLLKYVFKRLEWTWITFPTVVVMVSVAAYFAAYALKGSDLKINKVDLVDFDLRTDLDANRKPQNVHVYGHSFFTVLSPRIQNYTIGLEPNPAFWGGAIRPVMTKDGNANEVLNVDLLSWMGRPSGGPNDMGRSGSGGFFRNTYSFSPDASGLIGVPIPVWTTKAFLASWEQTLAKPPFDVDLVYAHQDDGVKVSGKLENHLGVDLVDVWLIYLDRAYPIKGGLQSVKQGAAPHAISIAAEPNAVDLAAWLNRDDSGERVAAYNPTAVIKQLLFNSKTDTKFDRRNHLLRPLDLGWRIVDDPRDARDRKTREAILFARARAASGNAEALTNDPNNPLPTKLWLGTLPGTGADRPALAGSMNQDTYIRVILPVRPARD